MGSASSTARGILSYVTLSTQRSNGEADVMLAELHSALA
jgi:hypothetical protein